MLTTDGSDHQRQQAQASASAGASDKRGHLTSFRAARKSLQSSAIDDSDEEASPAKAAEVTNGLDAALLQSNLEENFFFNQKSSVKQSIEFISGRLANNLIKTISQRIVTGELNRALAGLADDVSLLKSDTADVSSFHNYRLSITSSVLMVISVVFFNFRHLHME